MSNWFKVQTNEILCCGMTNSEIGLYIRYKALCEHFRVDDLTWEKIEFNFDCKERKVISKLFGITPEVSPKLVRSKSEVSLKSGNKNNDLANPYIQDKTRQDNTKKENITKENPDVEKFEAFWRDYIPVECDGRVVGKGSKQEAEKKFLKILKEGEDYENIRRGLQSYLQFCRRNNQLTCGATVFLNQRRWDDDYNSATTCSERNSGQRQEPISIVETYARIAAEYGNPQ